MQGPPCSTCSDRRGEHPSRHLSGYYGILQADAYAGFGDLYSEASKPVALAGDLCWAHGRRNFFKRAELAKAPLASEAVRRIDAIFDMERSINGLLHEQRARRAAGADRSPRAGDRQILIHRTLRAVHGIGIQELTSTEPEPSESGTF